MTPTDYVADHFQLHSNWFTFLRESPRSLRTYPFASEANRRRIAQGALNRVLESIQANFDRDLHLEDFANAAGMSAFQFGEMFKLKHR